MGSLTGKVAFITGAARGQGRAHAVKLASEGADIIAVDIAGPVSKYVGYEAAAPEDLELTVKEVESLDRRIVAKRADVRDLAALRAAVDEGVSTLGGLDIVVANAGICTYNLGWELAEDQWQDVIDTNLTGAWKTAKATIPTLIEQGRGGAIVFTSSTAGLKGLPFLGHYVASKHGVTGLTKTLANELGQYGIRVNSVHPGGVATKMGEDATLPGIMEKHPNLAPLMMLNSLPEQMVAPEVIADAVAFLVGDTGRYITGVQFPVDLGAVAR